MFNGPRFVSPPIKVSLCLDTNFLTTDPNSLSFNIKNSFFMPNPCDHSFEVLENYNRNSGNDIFFTNDLLLKIARLKAKRINIT